MTALDTRRETAARTPEPGRHHRGWWVLSGVAFVAVVGAGLLAVAAYSEHRSLQREARQLAASRSRLQETRADHADARTDLHAHQSLATEVTLERDGVRVAVGEAQAALTGVTGQLTEAQGVRDNQAIRLVNTRVCLDGVREALDATAARNQTGAQAALRRVSAPCYAAATPGEESPAFGFDFADPFLLRAGGDVYGFATNAGGGSVQVIRSRDLVSWELVGNALGNLPAWAAPNSTWAPAVLARPGGFVLYYTVREAATGRQCISAAIGGSPAGPYLDPSTGPLECAAAGSIDPSPFVDADGAAYLLWKSERPAQIWARRLTADGRGLTGAPGLLLTARQGWEGGNVEAPAMMRTVGGHWLFFSGNDWNGRRYAEGLAHCRSPLGPCEHVGSGPVLASHGRIAGPGGGEVFLDGAGTWWLAYHAYRDPAVGYPNSRLLHLRRVTINALGGPTL